MDALDDVTDAIWEIIRTPDMIKSNVVNKERELVYDKWFSIIKDVSKYDIGLFLIGIDFVANETYELHNGGSYRLIGKPVALSKLDMIIYDTIREILWDLV